MHLGEGLSPYGRIEGEKSLHSHVRVKRDLLVVRGQELIVRRPRHEGGRTPGTVNVDLSKEMRRMWRLNPSTSGTVPISSNNYLPITLQLSPRALKQAYATSPAPQRRRPPLPPRPG